MSYNNSLFNDISSIDSNSKEIFDYQCDSEIGNINYNAMISIFKNNVNENPLFDPLDKDCYFLPGDKSKDNKIKNIDSEEKVFPIGNRLKHKFIVNKKKKRGKQNTYKNNKYKRIHNYDSPDNILRKIHVDYLSFIVYYLNDILINLKYEERFYNLSYSFKRKINKNIFNDLKNQSIENIISNKISSKYKKKSAFSNKLILNQIKNRDIINKILSEKYIDLFRKIYYKSNKLINLKEYGVDKIIILSSHVKMYKDLLLKNKKKDIYIQKKFDKCIKQYFIPNSIFSPL